MWEWSGSTVQSCEPAITAAALKANVLRMIQNIGSAALCSSWLPAMLWRISRIIQYGMIMARHRASSQVRHRQDVQRLWIDALSRQGWQQARQCTLFL
jgi:hypothetical protein